MRLIFIMFFFYCMDNSLGQDTQTHHSSREDSLLIDGDGNKYSIKLMPDGNLWMTKNLKLKILASYCYNNTDEQCLKYGGLYTWESAKKACRLLGEGWEIPSVTDWQALSSLYSQDILDSTDKRKKAFAQLLIEGGSGFNALLGGGRDLAGQYARMEAHGFYWTATETGVETAWFVNFAKGSRSLFIQRDGEKERAFSVRCVRKKDN